MAFGGLLWTVCCHVEFCALDEGRERWMDESHNQPYVHGQLWLRITIACAVSTVETMKDRRSWMAQCLILDSSVSCFCGSAAKPAQFHFCGVCRMRAMQGVWSQQTGQLRQHILSTLPSSNTNSNAGPNTSTGTTGQGLYGSDIVVSGGYQVDVQAVASSPSAVCWATDQRLWMVASSSLDVRETWREAEMQLKVCVVSPMCVRTVHILSSVEGISCVSMIVVIIPERLICRQKRNPCLNGAHGTGSFAICKTLRLPDILHSAGRIIPLEGLLSASFPFGASLHGGGSLGQRTSSRHASFQQLCQRF